MSLSTEDVWRRFSDELEAFIARRVRDRDLASDLLQETFVRVHQGLPNLKDDERVLAWIYRVARNTIADHFRKEVKAESLDGNEHAGTAEPESDNWNEEMGRCLLGMLSSLPEEYRAAVELAEVEGIPQREVGERLGLSLSGAKSRVQRGREMLRNMLLECCHVELDRRGNVVDFGREGKCAGECGGEDAP